MLYHEIALITAVRAALRTGMPLVFTNLEDGDIDIEYDEMAHAAKGDYYVVVTPGGITPGPHNLWVDDHYVAVNITIILRAPKVPRDRQRDMFLIGASSIANIATTVDDLVGDSYAINDAANALILAEESSSEGFIEPLRFQGMDPKPTPASGSIFASNSKNQVAALKRTYRYGKARRLKTK